jgi:1,4-dihydroxy-2-naphthoate octaprenyltransferase
MSWMAYSVGALAAAKPGSLDLQSYWLGYIALFLLEAATVFCNDYFDFDSDRRNLNAGPFTGGSRVLVEGRVSLAEMRVAIYAALSGFVVTLALLTRTLDMSGFVLCGAYAVLATLALGYTVPPLKLSHRSLGELDVALTHSAGVIAVGYLVQGGSLNDPVPWLISVPLFFAVLPSIILSGVPDFPADRAAGKHTLVVKLGKRRAISAAMLACAAAAVAAVLLQMLGWVGNAYGPLMYAVVPHAAWLMWRLRCYRLEPRPPERIDGLMVLSLSYILWFCAVPLLRLL